MAELLDASAAGERRTATARGRAVAGGRRWRSCSSGMGPLWWGMARQLLARGAGVRVGRRPLRRGAAPGDHVVVAGRAAPGRGLRRGWPTPTWPRSPTSRCRWGSSPCGSTGGCGRARSSGTARARSRPRAPRARSRWRRRCCWPGTAAGSSPAPRGEGTMLAVGLARGRGRPLVGVGGGSAVCAGRGERPRVGHAFGHGGGAGRGGRRAHPAPGVRPFR